MSRKNIICVAIIVVITAVLIGVIAFGVIRNQNDLPPNETQAPVTDMTKPEDNGTEPTIPKIPDIKPNETGENDQKPVTPDDVVIDVLEDGESTERNDDPAIDGDVYIIPGMKGEDE